MAHPELKTVRWNLRKLVKELLLLEEHLSDPQQRCPDCIWKHLLKSEAWIEEAATLDNRREYTGALAAFAIELGRIQGMVRAGSLASASSATRALRKSLMGMVV